MCQDIIPADKKELFTIAPPMRVVTSACRNLPLAVAARKRGNIGLQSFRPLVQNHQDRFRVGTHRLTRDSPCISCVQLNAPTRSGESSRPPRSRFLARKPDGRSWAKQAGQLAPRARPGAAECGRRKFGRASR